MHAIRNTARALVREGRQVLLLECEIDGETRFVLPGGGQRIGELLSQTVCREVLEETGLEIEVGEVLWVREYVVNDVNCLGRVTDHRVDIIFDCHARNPDVLSTGDKADVGQVDVRWVAIDDLEGIVMWPEFVQQLLIESDGRVEQFSAKYVGNSP